MRRYTADFETTVEENSTHVWAWALCNLDDFSSEVGSELYTFMQRIFKLAPCDIYFHNLRFDAQFIIFWLLSNGFRYSDEKEGMTFNCCINDMNNFYKLQIVLKKYVDTTKHVKYRTIDIFDSLKKLPFKVEKIAKDFHLPIQKLNIDYRAERPYGYKLTEHEKEYVKHDVEIVARALKTQFDEGLTRMTIGSDCLSEYIQLIGGKDEFRKYFPSLTDDEDAFMRKAYHGGWCYVNPKYQNKTVGKGLCLDVNSLYPWAMRYNRYPKGLPVWFSGQYEYDAFHPLFIQRFVANFKLKPGFFPIVQVKGSSFYIDTEYLVESDEPTTLTMCDVDFRLFLESYDVDILEYIGGYKFSYIDGAFDSYIDKWMHRKENAETPSERVLAKLFLNNLYGKFASSKRFINKMPKLIDGSETDEQKEDETQTLIKYTSYKEEIGKGVYLPVGIWCTAYAREKTVRTALKCYDRFCYSDTDSIHLEGDVPDFLKDDVDDKKLGYWKKESTFVKAKFLKAKTYIELEESTAEKVLNSSSQLDYFDSEDGDRPYHLTVKCAGMPDNVKEEVTFENFKVGFTSNKKLKPKQVHGGVVLVDTDFTIKPFNLNKPII